MSCCSVVSNIQFERALFYSYKRCLPLDEEPSIKYSLSIYIPLALAELRINSYLLELLGKTWPANKPEVGEVARIRTYNSEEGTSSNWAQFKSEDEENGSYGRNNHTIFKHEPGEIYIAF